MTDNGAAFSLAKKLKNTIMSHGFSSKNSRSGKKDGRGGEEDDGRGNENSNRAEQSFARAEHALAEAGIPLSKPKDGFPSQLAYIDVIEAQEAVLIPLLGDASAFLTDAQKRAVGSSSGNEHKVWFIQRGREKRAVKSTLWGVYGFQDTPLDYLRRMAAFSRAFPAADVGIVGFVKLSGGGHSLITDHAFVKGIAPEQADLETYLRHEGFERQENSLTWTHAALGLKLHDNKAENWKQDGRDFMPVDVYAEFTGEPVMTPAETSGTKD